MLSCSFQLLLPDEKEASRLHHEGNHSIHNIISVKESAGGENKKAFSALLMIRHLMRHRRNPVVSMAPPYPTFWEVRLGMGESLKFFKFTLMLSFAIQKHFLSKSWSA